MSNIELTLTPNNDEKLDEMVGELADNLKKTWNKTLGEGALSAAEGSHSDDRANPQATSEILANDSAIEFDSLGFPKRPNDTPYWMNALVDILKYRCNTNPLLVLDRIARIEDIYNQGDSKELDRRIEPQMIGRYTSVSEGLLSSLQSTQRRIIDGDKQVTKPQDGADYEFMNLERAIRSNDYYRDYRRNVLNRVKPPTPEQINYRIQRFLGQFRGTSQYRISEVSGVFCKLLGDGSASNKSEDIKEVTGQLKKLVETISDAERQSFPECFKAGEQSILSPAFIHKWFYTQEKNPKQTVGAGRNNYGEYADLITWVACGDQALSEWWNNFESAYLFRQLLEFNNIRMDSYDLEMRENGEVFSIKDSYRPVLGWSKDRWIKNGSIIVQDEAHKKRFKELVEDEETNLPRNSKLGYWFDLRATPISKRVQESENLNGAINAIIDATAVSEDYLRISGVKKFLSLERIIENEFNNALGPDEVEALKTNKVPGGLYIAHYENGAKIINYILLGGTKIRILNDIGEEIESSSDNSAYMNVGSLHIPTIAPIYIYLTSPGDLTNTESTWPPHPNACSPDICSRQIF